MRSLQIALLVSVISFTSLSSAFAATNNANSGESRLQKTGSTIKRGVMWGPKKIGAGMKSLGEKTKKAFQH